MSVTLSYFRALADFCICEILVFNMFTSAFRADVVDDVSSSLSCSIEVLRFGCFDVGSVSFRHSLSKNCLHCAAA